MIKREIILESMDFTLNAQAWGNPTKRPILALHGWFDHSASFELLGEALANEYYILAPAQIG